MEQLIKEKIMEAVNLNKHICRDDEISGVCEIDWMKSRLREVFA